MTDEYPSHQLDKFVVRFPEGMREQLRTLADQNLRSMNAEIVTRLEESMNGARLIPAADAATIAEQALTDQLQALQHSIACAIRDAAVSGHRSAVAPCQEFPQAVIEQMVTELQALGYSIEHSPTAIHIRF